MKSIVTCKFTVCLSVFALIIFCFSCSSEVEDTAFDIKTIMVENQDFQTLNFGKYLDSFALQKATLVAVTNTEDFTDKIAVFNYHFKTCAVDSLQFVVIISDSLLTIDDKYYYNNYKKNDEILFDYVFETSGQFKDEFEALEDDILFYPIVDGINRYNYNINAERPFIDRYFYADVFKSQIASKNTVVEQTIDTLDAVFNYAFENEKPKGTWSTYYKGNLVATVSFNDQNLKSGPAKQYYWSDDSPLKIEENFINDKLEGEVKEYYENGNISYIGNYVNGERTGSWQYFYLDDNKLYSKSNYVNDKLEGTYQRFTKDSTLLITCNYSNDKLHGPYESYSDDGNLIYKGVYVKGEPDGEWINNHKNGKLYQKKKWDNGKLIDVFACYDEKGKKLDKGNFANGNGILNVYDKDGNFTKSLKYKNGDEVVDYYENQQDSLLFNTISINAFPEFKAMEVKNVPSFKTYYLSKMKYNEDKDEYYFSFPIYFSSNKYPLLTFINYPSWRVVNSSNMRNKAIFYTQYLNENTSIIVNGKKEKYNYYYSTAQGGNDLILDQLKGKKAYLLFTLSKEDYNKYKSRQLYLGFHEFNSIEALENYKTLLGEERS